MAKKGICTRAAVFLRMAAMLLSGCRDKGETSPGGEEDSAALEAAVKTEFTQEEVLADYAQLWAGLVETSPC